MKRVKIVFLLLVFAFQLNAQKVGLEVGDKAPNIVMSSPDGKTYSLYELKGKIVLIDFWASWCAPCRRENKMLVKTYYHYKDKDFKKGNGFTVFGVSLDKRKDSWKAAIKEDGLQWPYHVSDLKYWRSEAAQTFQIRGIPNNYLIDGDGVIIGKSLRGKRLDDALESIVLKKKSQKELEEDLRITLDLLDKVLSEQLEKEKDNKKYKILVKRKKQVAKTLKAFSNKAKN